MLDCTNLVLPDPPPFAQVRELGDSTVLLRFHGWVNQEKTDFQKVQSESIRLVKQAFDEANIEMPEPTYRLQLYQAGEAPPHAPKRPEGSIAEQAQSIDVLTEGHLEARVEEELHLSDEPNLLSR